MIHDQKRITDPEELLAKLDDSCVYDIEVKCADGSSVTIPRVPGRVYRVTLQRYRNETGGQAPRPDDGSSLRFLQILREELL